MRLALGMMMLVVTWVAFVMITTLTLRILHRKLIHKFVEMFGPLREIESADCRQTCKRLWAGRAASQSHAEMCESVSRGQEDVENDERSRKPPQTGI
jgi:hypothetical protein